MRVQFVTGYAYDFSVYTDVPQILAIRNCDHAYLSILSKRASRADSRDMGKHADDWVEDSTAHFLDEKNDEKHRDWNAE